jgi:multidrug resistance efflux pump
MGAFRKEWAVYGAAIAALCFAITSVTRSQPEAKRIEPAGVMPSSPFGNAIAATGVIEPSSRTIVVAPEIDGVVASISVEPGQRVKAGDPLFALDDRTLRAAVEEAAARSARAEAMIKLREAEQRAAEADSAGKRLVAARLRNSVERHRPIAETMSAEDFDTLVTEAETAVFAFRAAEQAAISASAAADAAVHEAELARAERAGAEADLTRTVLRSPIDASVLSIDVRIGEAVRAADQRPASITVGAVDFLVARVQIDEAEVGRFDPGAPASALLRGQEGAPIRLSLQSIEPMLKAKSDFRDAQSEYVDARVLEARYRIDATPSARMYVGQLLDVYIDASGGAGRAPDALRDEEAGDAPKAEETDARLSLLIASPQRGALRP